MSAYDSDIHSEDSVLLEDALRVPHQYAVLLLNDDYTTMEFVIHILQEIFRKNASEARVIMMSVHHKGKGVCGIYSKEIAETKVAQVHAKARAAGFPLRASMEEL